MAMTNHAKADQRHAQCWRNKSRGQQPGNQDGDECHAVQYHSPPAAGGPFPGLVGADAERLVVVDDAASGLTCVGERQMRRAMATVLPALRDLAARLPAPMP